MGSEALRLKRPFKASKPGEPLHEQLLGGIAYKVAPHVDQSEMYDAVFRSLSGGGCIGIFPEGGSHDRPSMLPLKAGIAIIALGALARDPNINLTILPCGLNYFNPHKRWWNSAIPSKSALIKWLLPSREKRLKEKLWEHC
jgi:glycerol-3-phosphate O-acyltransferase/dihydroxyacetone phosphate acyltransferase